MQVPALSALRNELIVSSWSLSSKRQTNCLSLDEIQDNIIVRFSNQPPAVNSCLTASQEKTLETDFRDFEKLFSRTQSKLEALLFASSSDSSSNGLRPEFLNKLMSDLKVVIAIHSRIAVYLSPMEPSVLRTIDSECASSIESIMSAIGRTEKTAVLLAQWDELITTSKRFFPMSATFSSNSNRVFPMIGTSNPYSHGSGQSVSTRLDSIKRSKLHQALYDQQKQLDDQLIIPLFDFLWMKNIEQQQQQQQLSKQQNIYLQPSGIDFSEDHNQQQESALVESSDNTMVVRWKRDPLWEETLRSERAAFKNIESSMHSLRELQQRFAEELQMASPILEQCDEQLARGVEETKKTKAELIKTRKSKISWFTWESGTIAALLLGIVGGLAGGPVGAAVGAGAGGAVGATAGSIIQQRQISQLDRIEQLDQSSSTTEQQQQPPPPNKNPVSKTAEQTLDLQNNHHQESRATTSSYRNNNSYWFSTSAFPITGTYKRKPL